MAEAKKKPTAAKAKKAAEVVAETVNTEAVPEIKIKKTRVTDSELMQEEDAQHSEQYSNTESEQGKDSTQQEPESDGGVDGSAGEQTGAVSKSGTAKAGKRSAKAAKEADEKEAKEARKASAPVKDEVKKPAPVKARSRAERAGKKYREVAKLIEKDKLYSLSEALELATKTSTTKFDATVELHISLGVDPRQADQNVRDTVALPAGTGKTVRVATLADEADAEALFAKLEKQEIDFDVLIATPTMMPKLGKYARLLGPRGLMPNPKSGTVTADVKTATQEAKAGRVEYRVDQAGIVHLGIGKVSFGAAKLAQNADAIMASIRSNRPSSLKGNYIKSISVSSTMGPGISVNVDTRS